MRSLSPIRYIRAHPFSTMALCNIVGDCGYLGYAFAAQGFVSLPKLIGASCTMMAHVILLAYGDDQAQRIMNEKGTISQFVLKLRAGAQSLTSHIPAFLRRGLRAKPVGISFFVLSVNGLGLLTDAISKEEWMGPVMTTQAILGVLIITGCGAFAAADFVGRQKTANILTKIAPTILTGASCASAVLAVLTWNPFLLMLIMAFALSNFAGFFTKIHKEKGQHLHS